MVDKPSSELLSATIGEPQDEVGDVVHASVGQVHLLSHLWRWDEESMEVGEDDDGTWRKKYKIFFNYWRPNTIICLNSPFHSHVDGPPA